MNKAAIQRFAIWARTEMIAQVSQRAYQYGITAESCGEENAVTVNGRVLSSDEQSQRRGLVAQIQQKGYQQVMEEVAYTWFNRFISLRFMEVNNYLPSHVRVFTDAEGAFKPEILSEALYLEMPGLDREKVAELIDKNQTDDLYRYLLLTQCNALNEALPRMFEKMGSYTELLLPNNILRKDGVLGRMISDIPEADWTDQVQIIGWLYQYYNAELKDDTFALLKKNIKVTKERIPSATQLFTPDWIVRYMVENSLGRLWIEGHPDNELKGGWKYYVDEAEQDTDVLAQLEDIRAEYSSLRPQDIKVIDPCMGSGHILVYAFDVLLQIYNRAGFSERDAVQSILENNLYGLDIDDRAAQLAYFAVMMKARQYDRRFFTRNVQPHIYAIIESNEVHLPAMWRLGDERIIAEKLVAELKDAKEYGSIINISLSLEELAVLRRRILDISELSREGNLLDIAESDEILNGFLPLINTAELLSMRYDVVVTNPPYMSSGGMSSSLLKYVKKQYPAAWNDLFAVFIERAITMANKASFISMITMESWMFLPTFELMRKKALQATAITTMVHMPYLGKGGTSLGIAFGNAAFVLRHVPKLNYNGDYQCIRYYETDDDGIPYSFPCDNERHQRIRQNNFSAISSAPIAYWASDSVFKIFEENKKLVEYADARSGISTGDNNRFYRCWFECDVRKIAFDYNQTPQTSVYKWFPTIRGGDFRKWYGNMENVLNLENDGYEIKNSGNNYRLRTPAFYNRLGITWNRISSRDVSFRVKTRQVNFGENSPCLFTREDDYLGMLAYLNSKVAKNLLEFINSTMTFQVLDIQSLPYKPIKSVELETLVSRCIEISKSDWDESEHSWDFRKHPLVGNGITLIEKAYSEYEDKCSRRFRELKECEEQINAILISSYGLSDVISTEVDESDVTVRKANKGSTIRSLISYAVGCMFGRFSLDCEGIILAGQSFSEKYTYASVPVAGMTMTGTIPQYTVQGDCYLKMGNGTVKRCTVMPDPDNIIPICDDDYFDDDITGKFIQWVSEVYGIDTLEENLQFIASCIGGRGTPRSIIRSYFLNDFFSDHCNSYSVTSVGKRPIYWLFDSGKKNGFKALVYMHRYQSDLLARMRTDYVHEQQERYRTQLRHIEDAMSDASTSERVKLSKQQAKLQEQALELQKYEEKIHHLADQNIQIDLDDGVKHNYALFADVLAKI